MNKFCLPIGLAILLSGLASASTWAANYLPGVGDSIGISPYWDWKQIETDHFRLYFPRDLELTAKKCATYLEQAHALESPILQWSPTAKTAVLVLDNADAANGMTSPALRFGIVLQVTPPDNWFSTAYYDDWLKILTFHEYTHTLNMDVTSGWFYKLLRGVFGDVFLPNTVWPSWMLEGLAVYDETRFTSAGRGRSPFWEMILRTSVASGRLASSEFYPLDKINDSNPEWPGGETYYLFGYEMMNAAARLSKGPSHGAYVLGDLSYHSGYRVPFFINGNVENLTGRDWYQTWDDWMIELKTRMKKDLDAIRSQPLTVAKVLTDVQYQALGSAASPSGEWLAYNKSSTDRRSSLMLLNLKDGKSIRAGDKTFGVALAWTPDSQNVVFSALNQYSLYELWSELGVYDLKQHEMRWLSSGLRARDPDVSRDGKWVTFTLTAHETTGVAMAPLNHDRYGSLTLGKVRVLYMPVRWGRASTPKFRGPGAGEIIFSLHTNQKPEEDLISLDPTTGKTQVLLANGQFNRFPAIGPDQSIYFVSDRTGVDNVYRLDGRTPVLVTNVTSGIWLPSFGSRGQLYASLYTDRGFEIAQITPSSTPLDQRAVHVAAPPYPVASADEQGLEIHPDTQVKNYSVFPSIWPREWAPLFYSDTAGNVSAGGEVYGFDATDRHRYLLYGLYDGTLKKPDWLALYSNRSLGPTLHLESQGTYSAYYPIAGVLERDVIYRLDLERPFRFTEWTLTPTMAFQFENQTYFQSLNTGSSFTTLRFYTSTADALLSYSDAESSSLGVTTERGGMVTLGSRAYLRPDSPAYKFILEASDSFSLVDHVALKLSADGGYVTQRPYPLSSSSVILSGRDPTSVLFPFQVDPLKAFPLHGYTSVGAYSRAAGVGNATLTFPIAPIFRGWGTDPLFLNQLYGFVYGEDGVIFATSKNSVTYLPSFGGGVKLTLDVLVRLPLVLGIEYDQGTNTAAYADKVASFTLGLGSLPF